MSWAKKHWLLSIISFLTSAAATSAVNVVSLLLSHKQRAVCWGWQVCATTQKEREKNVQPTSVGSLVTVYRCRGTWYDIAEHRRKRRTRQHHRLIRWLDTEADRPPQPRQIPLFAFLHFTKSISSLFLDHNSLQHQHIALAFAWTSKHSYVLQTVYLEQFNSFCIKTHSQIGAFSFFFFWSNLIAFSLLHFLKRFVFAHSIRSIINHRQPISLTHVFLPNSISSSGQHTSIQLVAAHEHHYLNQHHL